MSTQLGNIILDIFNLIFASITISVSASMLLLLVVRRATTKTDRVVYLLTANTYLSMLCGSLLLMDMSAHSLYGRWHPDSSFDDLLCPVKAYLIGATGSLFFYSISLQAFYRLCRVVFYNRLALRSFRRYVFITGAQWIFGFIQVLPFLFSGIFKYLDGDFHCQIAPTNLSGTLICLSVIYLVPYTLTLVFYIYTMYDVRTRSAALANTTQRKNVHRDMIVLTRLVIILTCVSAVGLPEVLIPIVYVATGNLLSWTINFGWLLTNISLAIVSIALIYVSPHLRKLCTRPHRVHVHPRQN